MVRRRLQQGGPWGQSGRYQTDIGTGLLARQVVWSIRRKSQIRYCSLSLPIISRLPPTVQDSRNASALEAGGGTPCRSSESILAAAGEYEEARSRGGGVDGTTVRTNEARVEMDSRPF